MADGGSFLSAGVGEPSRRAFLELDRRLAGVQATIDALSPAHGDLTGLGNDDHPQYLTEARGDARYYTQSQVNSSLSGKSDTSHAHSYLPLTGGTLTGQLTMGTSASIRQASTTWTGNPGSGVGKIEYHSNRWYIVAGSNSAELLRVRRDGSDKFVIDNNGSISVGSVPWARLTGVPSYASSSHTHSYIPTSSTQGSNLYIRNSSPTVYFRDTNHRSAMIHVNSDLFYILRGSGDDSTSWATHNGVWPLTINLNDNTATFGGDIYMRAVNNNRPYINRVGGIFFTWDSDSYGTNDHHSIRSTYGDSWTDAITINSYGHIRMNIDTNGNGSNTFTIGRHTTGTANTLLTLNESGDLTITGASRANEFRGDNGSSSDPSFTFASDGNLGLYRQGSDSLGFAPHGAYLNSAGFYLPSGDWFRTTGSVGWYNQTYGGGVYMSDSTYVRSYGSKRYYSDVDTGGYTTSGHGGMVIGGPYDKAAFNSTYARRHSIQMEVDTYWGGYHNDHTGALIWCGNMNSGAWGTAEWGVRTSNYWGSYYSGSGIRIKGTRMYASLGVETALNVHSDGAGRLGYYSSRKELKNLVGYVDKSEALSRICMLQPIDFTWKKEHRPHYDPDDELIDFNVHRGFFAEDAAAVDRTYGAWGWVYRDDESDGVGSLSMQPLTEELLRTDRTLEDAVVVAYNDKAIMADLVGAVQELNRRIMELETQ